MKLREGTLGMFAASLLASLGLGVAPGCGEDSTEETRDTAASGGAGGKSTGSGGRAAGATSGSGGETDIPDATPDAPLPDATTGLAPECRNSTPVTGLDGERTGYERCQGGSLHRPAVMACATALPRSERCAIPGVEAGAGCATDADCTARPNGYCSLEGGSSSCTCHYGCRADADCGEGSICVCGSPVGTCARAKCSSDADCAANGAGLLCLSYEYGCGRGFACQTTDDTCVAHADCKSGLCDLVDGVHACQPQSCVDGRPFLVGGSARVAALSNSREWSSTSCPAFGSLNAADRDAIGARWTEVALMEHASVAAFARFALELLSLGAPPDLLVATQQAIADEIAHAREAFALAGAYLGRGVGPGPLDVRGALSASSPFEIVRSTILEGCIGETVAALEATEALAHAADPAVRAALERVVVEETRHAELAYRSVQWVLHEGPPDLARATAAALVSLAESEAAAARRDAEMGAPPALNAVHAAHGVLDDRTRAAVRARVLAGVVVPCAKALADSVQATDAGPVRQRHPGIGSRGRAFAV